MRCFRGASPSAEPQVVAVKVAGSESDALGQWRSEVIALTRLQHPNIVRYLGYVDAPPMHCLVLECAHRPARPPLCSLSLSPAWRRASHMCRV